jgi:hypothetical protein
MKLSKEDSDNLNENSQIVFEAEGAPTLILLTLDKLQSWADAFAAGHQLNIGKTTIVGDPERSKCPGCEHDKHCGSN